MSIPLWCGTCGDVVGAESALAGISGTFSGKEDIPCPGKGKHQRPVRSEKEVLPGLVSRVTIEYEETFTASSWYEYTGPKVRRTFCAAMKQLRKLLRTKMEYVGILDIFVQDGSGGGGWAWSEKDGLPYGDGFDALACDPPHLQRIRSFFSFFSR
ncbi:MAG: hypothetical protein HYY60_00505 [Parcubacteria group bacterium]|nr:hypothetical protein [Parcubacteria group bacterium]MBI3075363.1 hypothetical protein [Parcubacteria group bacterium]